MHRYKELKVWQKAIDLAVEVYRVTEKLPKEERFGLISQINRCVVSIPSNIAEEKELVETRKRILIIF